jgi:hypothetical protein
VNREAEGVTTGFQVLDFDEDWRITVNKSVAACLLSAAISVFAHPSVEFGL